jgi:hypothetical protein
MLGYAPKFPGYVCISVIFAQSAVLLYANQIRNASCGRLRVSGVLCGLKFIENKQYIMNGPRFILSWGHKAQMTCLSHRYTVFTIYFVTFKIGISHGCATRHTTPFAFAYCFLTSSGFNDFMVIEKHSTTDVCYTRNMECAVLRRERIGEQT